MRTGSWHAAHQSIPDQQSIRPQPPDLKLGSALFEANTNYTHSSRRKLDKPNSDTRTWYPLSAQAPSRHERFRRARIGTYAPSRAF